MRIRIDPSHPKISSLPDNDVLCEGGYLYMQISAETHSGKVGVCFYPRTIELCPLLRASFMKLYELHCPSPNQWLSLTIHYLCRAFPEHWREEIFLGSI
jgi:hypothetical protein